MHCHLLILNDTVEDLSPVGVNCQKDQTSRSGDMRLPCSSASGLGWGVVTLGIANVPPPWPSDLQSRAVTEREDFAGGDRTPGHA